MVTPTNHVIAGPDLHRARPLALWDFRNIFMSNIGEDQKKSCDFSSGPQLVLRHIMVNPA